MNHQTFLEKVKAGQRRGEVAGGVDWAGGSPEA